MAVLVLVDLYSRVDVVLAYGDLAGAPREYFSADVLSALFDSMVAAPDSVSGGDRQGGSDAGRVRVGRDGFTVAIAGDR